MIRNSEKVEEMDENSSGVGVSCLICVERIHKEREREIMIFSSAVSSFFVGRAIF